MAAKERVSGFKSEIEKKYSKMSVAGVCYMDDIEKLQKGVASKINSGVYAREDDGKARVRTGDDEVKPESITDEDVMDYYLKKHPNIRGCFATNADAVKSIINSMERTKSENIMVAGFDADEEEIEMLKKGKIDGLIVQNTYGMGYASVIAAARAALSMGNEAQVDTGYTWVTKNDLNDDNIKKTLYNE